MKTAVHVGEHFNVALTCSVLDTPRLAAVPDIAQIEPATVQFPPFEVMGGLRHPDVRAGSRRYFQFEYTLRVIADSFFGRDLPIPPVTLKYSLSMSSGDGSQQGRERAYILPAIPVRVISLVPQQAGDIRDASRNTFADIQKRRVRSQAALTAAVVLFVFAGVFMLLAATSSVARYRGTAVNAPPRLTDRAVIAACSRVLGRARKSAANEGWSPALVGECLAALRIAAAIALQRPVSQTLVEAGAAASEGQIAARMGLLRPRRVLVSAATTPTAISAQLARASPDFAPRLRPVIEKLRDSLIIISSLRYSRAGSLEGNTIDGAVDSGSGAIRVLRLATLAPVRFIDSSVRAGRLWRLAWTK
ncbi:MAG: hypothetical protein WDO68_30495 [Gammaproteobacteria bacterium]